MAYLGHVLMDRRHGLIAGEQVTTANGTAEVDAAVQLATASSRICGIET